ncbi:ABC transporter permease [Streptomyces sp. NPDC012389]|uniref:ABC transporter permease n=1 Tax=unclassified Streptomyces TaxID=2593676 RepID=UPI00081D9D63|nr:MULTISPECIES: ABC transporter permease [unclassified Streptomyces]MYR96684.1 ABC transporter permease [Streptomyces sp. SID4937]MYX16639.1 ABC transporter permease [Streptomyces sp. SID8374]SCE14465.1 ABC-2 type transport system permease protein [Streptomyces sp. ScaeMP-e83]
MRTATTTAPDTAPAPRTARRRGPATAVLIAETRLFLREPGSLFWVFVFPSLLLVILGFVPAFKEVRDDLGGRRVIDLYVPISILLAMITAAIQAMPPVLTAYRERGILRRMSATPVRPSALLAAQIVLHAAACLGSALLVTVVGRTAYGVPLPGQLPGYLLALLLAVAAALSLGAAICALARTAKAAIAVGSAAYLVMMFTAGVWLPVQAMPDILRRVVEITPFGAASQALEQAASGSWPGWIHLGVVALWTAVLGVAASRLFRWQ